MRDFIIGGGFIGCALKTLMPEATLISKGLGNVFPLVLVHHFEGWEKFYPKAEIKTCKLEYEQGYNIDEYFQKSRGEESLYSVVANDEMPKNFQFLDFSYEEYFDSFDFMDGFVTELYPEKHCFVLHRQKVYYDNLFITIPLVVLKFKTDEEAKMKKKLALFEIPGGVRENKITYFSNKLYHRTWEFKSKAVSGIYIEQSVDSILPNNIVLNSPTGIGKFLGIFGGHVSGKLGQSQEEFLKKNDIYVYGRNARLTYERIDQVIEKIIFDFGQRR